MNARITGIVASALAGIVLVTSLATADEASELSLIHISEPTRH